jgi:mycoredoxin
VAKLELFGSTACPHTRELREWLEWRGVDFIEYDVEADRVALERMRAVCGGLRTVPVLVDQGRVIQIGWQGRSCTVAENNRR